MMNWILVVMAAIASVVIAMIVGGLLAPARVETTRAIRIGARRDEVWRLLRAVEQVPDWYPTLPALEVLREQPPEQLVLRLRNDSQDIVAEWQVTLEAQGEETQVAVHESSVTTNPIARFLRSFRNRTARMDRFLRGAAEQLGDAGAVPYDR